MDNIFKNAVDNSSHFLSKRDEIIDLYQDKYGNANWRKQIVDDLQKAFPDAKRASLAREFQMDKRLGTERYKSSRVGKSTREKYEALGKTLPRIPNKGDVTITVKGTQKGNKGRKDRNRSITVTLKGDKATSWVNNPNYQDIWDEYGFDFDEAEDGDYSLDVSSVSA